MAVFYFNVSSITKEKAILAEKQKALILSKLTADQERRTWEEELAKLKELDVQKTESMMTRKEEYQVTREPIHTASVLENKQLPYLMWNVVGGYGVNLPLQHFVIWKSGPGSGQLSPVIQLYFAHVQTGSRVLNPIKIEIFKQQNN